MESERMKLYTCKLCGAVCTTGKEDPEDMETADEHIIYKHYKQVLSTFFDKKK